MLTQHGTLHTDVFPLPLQADAPALIAPYGGELVNLLADESQVQRLKREAIALPSLELNPWQLADLELLLNGGFSPLRGFMNQADYESVLSRMRTGDGLFWPVPLVLDVTAETARQLAPESRAALRDAEGVLLAILNVSDMWQADKEREARLFHGASAAARPGAVRPRRDYYVGGAVQGLALPVRYDYRALRRTPAQLRKAFTARGWTRIAAFQADDPLHDAALREALRAAHQCEAKLLIHPLTGTPTSEDIHHFHRVRCYQNMVAQLPKSEAALALLPLASHHGADARTTLWHAIIHRNHGCSHFIADTGTLAPRMDGVRADAEAAQTPAARCRELTGVELLPLEAMGRDATNAAINVYTSPSLGDWQPHKLYVPRATRGFTVFFTGLSGAGKSTLAKALAAHLMESSERQVSLLDGDIVRKHLSNELGFSKEHRDINVLRIGYVSSEITKHRGIAICAPIAPYRATRRAVRAMIEPYGGFFEIYVATPLTVCERRDGKGLYAKARAGIIKEFTGISDPYETPEAPDLTVDTSNQSPEQTVQRILDKLCEEGFI